MNIISVKLVYFSPTKTTNQAKGKSLKTVSWYSDILGLFADYLHDEWGQDDI